MNDPETAAAAPSPPASEPSPVQPRQVAFDGPRGPLFRLLLRNLLLTVITLGIYRFWAKTRVRRFFWRHTRLLDEPLEYVGTGGELFVGFLIAIVILAPLGGTYSLLQFFMLDAPQWQGIAVDILYYAGLAFLIQVAIHRMRRYRLTRTAWRGIRFGLDGSSVVYALISFGWGIVTMLTLGLAYPWLRVATMGYFFRHARFGTAAMSLDARGGWLFPRWLAVVAPIAAGTALFFVLNQTWIAELFALNERAARGEDISVELQINMVRFQYWPLLLFVASSVVGVWYRVVEFRYLAGGVGLGEVGLRSELGAGFVYVVYFLFWFLALAVGGGAVAAFIALSPGPGASQVPPVVVGIAMVLGFLLFLALFGTLRTLFVDVTLLKRACATLSVDNEAKLDEVVQASADLPSHGEGLADALDVGGF